MNEESSAGFNPQQTLHDAKETLGHAITPGIALGEAVRILQSNNFTCRNTEVDSTSATGHSMLCTLATTNAGDSPAASTASPAPVNWFVTLDSNDGATLNRIDIQRYPEDIGG